VCIHAFDDRLTGSSGVAKWYPLLKSGKPGLLVIKGMDRPPVRMVCVLGGACCGGNAGAHEHTGKGVLSGSMLLL